MRRVWWLLRALLAVLVLLLGLCFLGYGGIFALSRPPAGLGIASYGLEGLGLFVLLPTGICLIGLAIWLFWALWKRWRP